MGGQPGHPGLVAEDGTARPGRRRVHASTPPGVPVRSGIPRAFDGRRLADAGNTGDADVHGTAGIGHQLLQQRLGLLPVIRPVDSTRVIARASAERSPSRIVSARADIVAQVVAEALGQLVQQTGRGVGDHGARRKIAAAPAAYSSSKSPGGMTPPTTTMMSGRPTSARASRSAGTRVRCPAASDDTPRCARRCRRPAARPPRGGEQRTHVDVEADVGERRRDDLLAAVVAVLAHLGDQDARPAARRPRRTLDQLCGTHVLAFPDLVPVDAGDGPDLGLVPAVNLLQRVGDLADGRLGPAASMASASRLLPRPSSTAPRPAPGHPASAARVAASSGRRAAA